MSYGFGLVPTSLSSSPLFDIHGTIVEATVKARLSGFCHSVVVLEYFYCSPGFRSKGINTEPNPFPTHADQVRAMRLMWIKFALAVDHRLEPGFFPAASLSRISSALAILPLRNYLLFVYLYVLPSPSGGIQRFTLGE